MAEALFPEEAWVEIVKIDGTAVNVTTDIDNFEEGGFEREVEFRPFFHNAKVTIKKQQSEGELTVNAKITRALWDNILWGATGSDFTSGGTQDPYRITFLVTKQTSVASASEALGSGYDHYRKVYANAFMTSFNPKLEVEGMLEGEATFSVSPVDEDGDDNVRIQIGSEAFGALNPYVTGTKW